MPSSGEQSQAEFALKGCVRIDKVSVDEAMRTLLDGGGYDGGGVLISAVQSRREFFLAYGM